MLSEFPLYSIPLLRRVIAVRRLLQVSFFIAFAACISVSADADTLTLRARSQVSNSSGGQPQYTTKTETLNWKAEQTAIIVCDMWDQHWCEGATKRVAEMAAHMNSVITQARSEGVLIIHCPSSVVDYYKDTPMRKLAQQATPVETALPLKRWAHLDPAREPPLPIDDSDGGCDCDPPCKTRQAWSRQIETIDIHPEDAITDNAEAFFLMKQRGIQNVIVMGVHMNMCVLGRPFSIRQMVYQGQNVVLMRDLSDTMYNHRQSPYVNHFDGNRLVTMHIERYWCPTITSADITGQPAFQFAADE